MLEPPGSPNTPNLVRLPTFFLLGGVKEKIRVRAIKSGKGPLIRGIDRIGRV
jgi:hypothetical protein